MYNNFIFKILIVSIFFILNLKILAVNDCPFGIKDCPEPGKCGRYIDIDNNKICDKSQLTLETNIVNNVKNESFDLNFGPELPDITTEITTEIELKNKVFFKDNYNFISITFITLLLYFITRLMLKKKKIDLLTFRKFWNVLLLIFFLICGISGILLLFNINTIFGMNILILHVISGIIMFLLTCFHIIERIIFFKNILK